MKGRVFDAVAYLTHQYGPSKMVGRDPQELREELLDAGYEEDEVERALAWLRRLARGGVPPGKVMAPAPDALRVATPEEGRKLTAAGRGVLLRLERAGLLDPETREAVYERALTLDVPELGEEEVRVLAALLLRARPGADQDLAERILRGDLEGFYH